MTRIRVAALDGRRIGWSAGSGSREAESVVAAVARLGPPPHILALTGIAGLWVHGSTALLSLTRLLNRLLPDNDVYYPFLSERPGMRNPPGLWLSARHVAVVAHHRMPDPSEPRPPDEVHRHTVEVFAAGGRMWLKAVHWQEPDSPQGATIQSVVDSQLAAVPSVLLGNFAASPGGNHPRPYWAEHRASSKALERVLRAGFWDAGRVAASPGESAGSSGGSAVGRILVSYQTRARLVAGSYVAGPAEDRCGQVGVACDLDFGPASQQDSTLRQH